MIYKIISDSIIKNISTNTFFDINGNSQELDNYREWVADGNAPEPADPIITPPITIVTMRQARLALLQAGKLADVTTAINSLPSPKKEAAQIEWEYSQVVERNRPFVVALAPALGLTDAQLDDLFTLASTL